MQLQMSRLCPILINKRKYIYQQICWIIYRYTMSYIFLALTGKLFYHNIKKVKSLIIYISQYSIIVEQE